MTWYTYIDLNSSVEEEGFSGRMFEGRVSVELEDSSVPFDAVQRHIQHLVATVKLCALASPYDFRIHRQREIL